MEQLEGLKKGNSTSRGTGSGSTKSVDWKRGILTQKAAKASGQTKIFKFFQSHDDAFEQRDNVENSNAFQEDDDVEEEDDVEEDEEEDADVEEDEEEEDDDVEEDEEEDDDDAEEANDLEEEEDVVAANNVGEDDHEEENDLEEEEDPEEEEDLDDSEVEDENSEDEEEENYSDIQQLQRNGISKAETLRLAKGELFLIYFTIRKVENFIQWDIPIKHYCYITEPLEINKKGGCL